MTNNILKGFSTSLQFLPRQFQIWLQNVCHLTLSQISEQNERRAWKALYVNAFYFFISIFPNIDHILY